MTKQEILQATATFIAGQGKQIDIGGKLADIITGIVGIIPETAGEIENIAPQPQVSATSFTIQKIGSGLCEMVLRNVKVSDGQTATSKVIAKLDEKYTPSKDVVTVVCAGSSNTLTGVITIDTAGNVRLNRIKAAGTDDPQAVGGAQIYANIIYKL